MTRFPVWHRIAARDVCGNHRPFQISAGVGWWTWGVVREEWGWRLMLGWWHWCYHPAPASTEEPRP